MKRFIHETAVYELMSSKGIKVPPYQVINKTSGTENLSFQNGEPVVVKGLGDNLWHKSDHGALHFVDYSPETIVRVSKAIIDSLNGKFDWIETLVVKKVKFKTMSNLPTEAFMSIKNDAACGMVVSFGLGGIHTEAWACALRAGIMMWPTALMTPKDALSEFKNHLIGKVWLGLLRQGKPLTSEKQVLGLFEGLWQVASEMKEKNIELLEVNPVVLDEFGDPIILDGVGQYGASEALTEVRDTLSINSQAVLRPKKIAIAGVSEKSTSFGKKILDNLLLSGVDRTNLTIIKPGTKDFAGVKCIESVKELKAEPVDALVVSLPANISVELLTELLEQGGGASVLYLVAGGIGDGADKKGYGKKIKEMLATRRANNLWTPVIVGPNSLGIVLAEDKINTLFISPERLPIHFNPDGNLGLVSQSGAFFITRFSNDDKLPVKYGFCIGNQMDLKVSDFVKILDSDKDVKVIGTYIEGFDAGEALRFSQAAKEVIQKGKPVILYKGGRSEEGQTAAAGHTGAMAGNYLLQKTLFEKAGIKICESFEEFSSLLRFYSKYPDFRKPESVAVISNAGFETVGSADFLGADPLTGRANLLKHLGENEKNKLEQMIVDTGLSGLVSPHNPLDVTPSAGEESYYLAAKIMCEADYDAVVVCIVPLTEKLNISDSRHVDDFAGKFKALAQKHKKPVIMVIDSGDLYKEYRDRFDVAGLPVYRSIETAFLALV